MSWPTDITAMDKGRVLEVAFDDGRTIRLTAERLRVESPSAEVQGHSPSQKRTVTGKESVAIVGIEPVGNYAIKIVFDDGHDTGLYTWDYLRKLATSRLRGLGYFAPESDCKSIAGGERSSLQGVGLGDWV